ncbi:MAG: hypothetical protein K2H88_07830 [Duncaniella sp.]|nr:hypothetical protein [Duncaniella sp.]MDE5918062.1 hypothetical protein [Duncaniella sp.]MDE6169535.1 hypothetical protein [Duncaniella sp.]MDE6359175.1 hypothetical protein [Duncaniella sp.]
MTVAHKRQRKLNLLKVLRLFLPVCLFISLCVVMCVPVDRSEDDGSVIVAEEAPVTQILRGLSVHDLEKQDTVSFYKRHLDFMPEPTQRMKVNYFGNLRHIFNDSNHVHLAEAEKYGITPLSDTRSHWQLHRPIVRITTCEDYYLDTLIFSRPYLVPEAARSLREIGKRFRDTIAARGGGDYRIKVTSVLRTPQNVKRLRRRNRNAIDSSVHQYGTTFDISYASFVAGRPAPARSVDDLKGVLAEVLKAMREEGKLWVKYERGQPCFHITARKPKED